VVFLRFQKEINSDFAEQISLEKPEYKSEHIKREKHPCFQPKEKMVVFRDKK